MHEGTKFQFKIDETGLEYGAKIKSIGSEVDPVSQTISVSGVFEKLPSEVLSGMSGSALFQPSSKTAMAQ